MPVKQWRLFAANISFPLTWRAYAIRPYDFLNGAETNGFIHLDLRDCFTIQDEFANGEPSSAGRQWLFRDREPWFEIRAKYICHLRNEGCFLRKTAIATAIMKLSLAQTSIATAIMKLSLAQTPIATAIMKLSLAQTLIATAITKLSLRHRCFGHRDGTLYTTKSPSSHLRWMHCRQNKGLEACAKVLYAPCIWRYFMPDTPTNRPTTPIS